MAGSPFRTKRVLAMTTHSGTRLDWRSAFIGPSLRMSALLALLSAMALSGTPSQADQVPIPRPKPKPDINSLQKSPTGSRLVIPIPVAKPGVLKDLPRGVVSLAVVPNDEYAACLQDLEASGAEFERPFHVVEEGCTLNGAVTLISVPTTTGRVALAGRPKMLCPFAVKFTRWLTEVGAPIIVQRLGSPLAAIQTGSGFVCRNRVGGSVSKVSEHARGNALDLMGFNLKNKHRITVEEMPTSSVAAALSGLRTSACGYFTTVLGPGSNAAHKNHLHFDLGQHGKSGKYRICE
jgi:hypothetical protein